jgi:hypothetical protein
MGAVGVEAEWLSVARSAAGGSDLLPPLAGEVARSAGEGLELAGLLRDRECVVQQLLVADALPFESVVALPLLQSPDDIVRRPSLH